MPEPAAIIGGSRALLRALERASSAARSQVPLLILGESGTGKEVLARHVHSCSPRRAGPFVPVNATALPFHLLESELFGHERGAFTGADRTRAGLFQEAHGGTLLIDEIGDLPFELQAKLLRVLQSGEVRPLGRNRAVPVDVRVVCATHRELRELVRRGAFREDLFYRIAVFTLELPPLRERQDDVVQLAEHFLSRYGGDLAPALSPEAIAVLLAHDWPGNVRELENACRHALVLCPAGEAVLPEHLPQPLLDPRSRGVALTLREACERVERERIEHALAAAEGNRTLAARCLGMARQTLHAKIRRLRIGGSRGPGPVDAWVTDDRDD
jgi:transcriptional regulator with PAS, ATPase and Fis domain